MPQWKATRARALRIDSFLFRASHTAGFTGSDQRNLPSLSISPDSSSVSHTCATCVGWKLNSGIAMEAAVAAAAELGSSPPNIGNGAGRPDAAAAV